MKKEKYTKKKTKITKRTLFYLQRYIRRESLQVFDEINVAVIIDQSLYSFVESSIRGFLRLRFLSLTNLGDINFELRLFTNDLFGQIVDCRMHDGNWFGECVVPTFNRIIRTRKICTYPFITILEFDWKIWFLAAST